MIIQRFYDQASLDDIVQVRFSASDHDPREVLVRIETAIRNLSLDKAAARRQNNAEPRPLMACPMEIGEDDDHTHD